MNLKELKELNEKFIKGREGLTNDELEILIATYENFTNSLDFLDSTFSLFKKELWARLEMLQGFKRSREIKS